MHLASQDRSLNPTSYGAINQSHLVESMKDENPNWAEGPFNEIREVQPNRHVTYTIGTTFLPAMASAVHYASIRDFTTMWVVVGLFLSFVIALVVAFKVTS